MAVTGEFSTSIGGCSVLVRYSINGKHECKTSFSYLGRPLDFNMTRWSGSGWGNFLQRFYERRQNASEYGSMRIDENGLPIYNIGPDQTNRVIVRSAKDVFKYVDQLLHNYQKQILDYCVWYRVDFEILDPKENIYN